MITEISVFNCCYIKILHMLKMHYYHKEVKYIYPKECVFQTVPNVTYYFIALISFLFLNSEILSCTFFVVNHFFEILLYNYALVI